LIKTLLQQKKPSIKQGLPVKNKTFVIEAFITLLLLSIAVGTRLNLGRANPFLYYESVRPPNDAKPPAISTLPLRNNTVYASNNLSLIYNVSIPESKYSITIYEIRYERDWKDSIACIYHRPMMSPGLWKTEYSYNLSLTEIPDGNRNITFIATATGGYAEGLTAYSFSLETRSVINFTVDTNLPCISSLSVENKTYATHEVPLNFTVNEPVSQISYVLDGQKNVTVNGNTTLTGLTDGLHNVTVYAKDLAGNVGASQTLTFTIAEEPPESFPTTLVAVASAVAVTAVAIGLLLYRKRRQEARQA
jgi:hypothetical protein